MSSIDPGIALAAKVPQQPDSLLDTYGKYLSMRNMLNQGQIQQQNLQEGQQRIQNNQLQNQQLARQVKGQQVVAQSVQNGTKFNDDGSVDFDHDGIQGEIVRGGFPDLALKYAQDNAGMEKVVLDNASAKLDLQSKKDKTIGATAQSILNADYSMQPSLLNIGVQQLQKQGLLDTKTVQSNPLLNGKTPYGPQTQSLLQQLADKGTADPAGAYRLRMAEQRAAKLGATTQSEAETKLSDEQIKLASQTMGGAKDQTSWDNARAALPKDVQANVPEQYSEQARQQIAMSGVSPDTKATLARYNSPTELAYAAQGGDKKAQTALNELKQNEIDVAGAREMAPYKMLMGNGGMTTGNTPVTNGFQAKPVAQAGQLNTDVLSRLNPAVASQVKMLAEGRMEFPGGFAMRSPYWQAMLSTVAQYDPNFDQTNYNTRAKTRANFTNGAAAQSNNALNTVIQHLDRLNTSVDGLGNTDYPVINSIKNWGKQQTGAGASLNKFNTDVGAVADEATRAYRGAGGSESDIEQWKKNLSSADSPQALKSTIAEMGDLLEGKINANQHQFDQALGPLSDIKMLAPQSEAVLNKLRGKPAITPATKPITPDLMMKSRRDNPGMSDADIIKNLAAHGYAPQQ